MSFLRLKILNDKDNNLAFTSRQDRNLDILIEVWKKIIKED